MQNAAKMQEQAREVEAFLDGLAKQIKAFEDKTGHRFASNLLVRLNGQSDTHFPFAYCRAADMVCPGCGEIHNGGEAVQATFLNTMDLNADLSAYPVTEEGRHKAFDKFVRNFDPVLPAGGPKAHVVDDGDAVYREASAKDSQATPNLDDVPADLPAPVRMLLQALGGSGASVKVLHLKVGDDLPDDLFGSSTPPKHLH